jgi:hypothetical protein
MSIGAEVETICLGCGINQRREGGRKCLQCHAAWMREWRKGRPMTPEQRRRDAARSYAGVYKRRGRLAPQPCRVCGSEKVEMHHEDYDKPLDVTWLCRPCHLALHRSEAA